MGSNHYRKSPSSLVAAASLALREVSFMQGSGLMRPILPRQSFKCGRNALRVSYFSAHRA